MTCLASVWQPRWQNALSGLEVGNGFFSWGHPVGGGGAARRSMRKGRENGHTTAPSVQEGEEDVQMRGGHES